MSPPPGKPSYEIIVDLKGAPSLRSLVEPTRLKILKQLGAKSIPVSDDYSGPGSPFNAISLFDDSIYAILMNCSQFAIKGKITLIVSIVNGYTKANFYKAIHRSLYLECQEAKLARLAQDVVDDIKDMKRKTDAIVQYNREKMMIEDALKVIVDHLSKSNYCEVFLGFDKGSSKFDIRFHDYGDVHPPLPEADFLYEPEAQKGQIRALLRRKLNAILPISFYFYQWQIHDQDPEDFEAQLMEFQNLLPFDDWQDEQSTYYPQYLVAQRKQAYQEAILEAGGYLSFAANFFFSHVLDKILYAIPVVGTGLAIYDFAQLAAEVPDGVKFLVKALEDDQEEEQGEQ